MAANPTQHYLQLLAHPRLGPVALSRLLVHYGTLGAALASPEHGPALQRLLDGPTATGQARLQAWLETPSHSLLLFEDPAYPALLKQASTPPPLLYVNGDPACLQAPALAVVGSRKCSAYGERQARWLSTEVARAGLVIVSGLARGIDAVAHRAALDQGGPTIAVVGTGINRVYPPEHGPLAQQIAGQGAVISEFPLDAPPRALHFPRRNRLISGLALGTLVVEAGLRSGSLISARQAMEQNREVFAVPGPIDQAVARGCHQLLKQGAKLVECAGDILEELPCHSDGPTGDRPAAASGSPRQRSLLTIMAGQPCLYETLLAQAGMSDEELTATLLELELAGQIRASGGRYIPL